MMGFSRKEQQQHRNYIRQPFILKMEYENALVLFHCRHIHKMFCTKFLNELKKGIPTMLSPQPTCIFKIRVNCYYFFSNKLQITLLYLLALLFTVSQSGFLCCSELKGKSSCCWKNSISVQNHAT